MIDVGEGEMKRVQNGISYARRLSGQSCNLRQEIEEERLSW